MTSHVHRDGPHQITVDDDHGNITRFVTIDDHDHGGHQLQIEHPTRDQPHLDPQTVTELAAELQQWATTQYTRHHRHTPAR